MAAPRKQRVETPSPDDVVIGLIPALQPTFKGSESPFHFFALRALHTTRSRGPAHHRAAGDGIAHQTSARPVDHLLLIGS